MIIIERRLDMYLIDPQMLRTLMESKGYTVRSLAEEVEREIRKKDRTLSCKHATIGHLRSGRSRNTKPQIANAIERILIGTTGVIFIPKVSTVTRNAAPHGRHRVA